MSFDTNSEEAPRIPYPEAQARYEVYAHTHFSQYVYEPLWIHDGKTEQPKNTYGSFFRTDTQIEDDRIKPDFLKPSGTEFPSVPVEDYLGGRGITNRLLNNLLTLLPEGAIIAGGFAHSVVAETNDATDIDIFFTSSEAFGIALEMFAHADHPENASQKVIDMLEAGDEKPWAFKGYVIDPSTEIHHLGQNKQNWGKLRYVKLVPIQGNHRPPIQLIKLAWYENAAHVIDSFDLTMTQFAFTPVTDKAAARLVFNPVSFLDVARKRLVLHRMQFPASSLRRVIKYSKKGYYACPGALVKIAEATQEALNKDPGLNGKVVYVD